MQSLLTILICTHNRQQLLTRVLASLNEARRPSNWKVELFVVANACTDSTVDELRRYEQDAAGKNLLPLRWIEETIPGKSHALNTAIPLVENSDIVAFVDDDHRVDDNFLVEICHAADMHPEYTLFCGRILPDWDGSEPSWVHDEGEYRIRPLPIPRSDGGPVARELTQEDPTPGGGNLFLRGDVFQRAGRFSTDLGPQGHNLGGGEDSIFVQNALGCGERLIYIPDVLQYHYVDNARLKFRYVLRKAFHRSRSHALPEVGSKGVPRYMWRKLASYGLGALSLNTERRRFHLVRIATTLGEISAHVSAYRQHSPRLHERRRTILFLTLLLITASLGVFTAGEQNHSATLGSLSVIGGLAGLLALVLGIKSIADFSHTGPSLRDEVLSHYRSYTLFAFSRLLVHAYLILCVLITPGVLLYSVFMQLYEATPGLIGLALAGLAGLLLVFALQFSRALLYLPASIAASSHYRLSRFYPYWRKLTPARLRVATLIVLLLPVAAGLTAAALALTTAKPGLAPAIGLALLFYLLLYLWLREQDPAPRRSEPRDGQPNILMIGSDTLRSDRIGGSYHRDVAPFLRELSGRGVLFEHCYVPCARTAPSLIALLTGTWPHRLGVRDNFVSDEQTRLDVESLPRVLRRHGYYTAALSDWCGADMGKFSLGFDHVDVPGDQWNLKTFIRQGPKDLRLFLSMFARNRYGKCFLPEIYYLGGVPLTDALGRTARGLITQLSTGDKPFFLNLFFSTTHGPFGSEYPYYTRYSDAGYDGESKFVMARLNDPFEIIRRQGEPREEFDLDQIIDLYDGCVTRFDDEVRRILDHLDRCGQRENTLVVIYSDHGMEFFEHETWGQGNSAISDVSNRIPLLIADGSRLQPGIVSSPVRSIDLPATLLDLVGIPAARSMDGSSLATLLRSAHTEVELDAFCETGIWLTDLPGIPAGHLRYPNLMELLTVRDTATGTISLKPEYEARVVRAKDRMIRRGRWKLVYQPLESGYLLKLFDMEHDPGCRQDLAGSQPLVVADLWERLQAWMALDPLQETPC